MQKIRIASVLAASAFVLAGCSATPVDDGKIQVTASTNVYGSLAAQIGGDRVEVTTIIDSVTQDPHSYEATARDRLAVRNADLVVQNGGGYDAFIDTLIDGGDAPVLIAAEFSHDYPGRGDEHEEAHEHNHIEGFNEHVWLDPHTMIHVVEGIAEELGQLDPDGTEDFTASADEIIADLERAEDELEAITTEVNGAGVFMTEPLPGYIAAAAGLTDRTPEGFAEAVEEGSDVAPATLLAALEAIESGDVAVVLTNAQTGGAETARVEEEAAAAGIPVVAFTELLEDGSSYPDWMQDAIQRLAEALRS